MPVYTCGCWEGFLELYPENLMPHAVCSFFKTPRGIWWCGRTPTTIDTPRTWFSTFTQDVLAKRRSKRYFRWKLVTLPENSLKVKGPMVDVTHIFETQTIKQKSIKWADCSTHANPKMEPLETGTKPHLCRFGFLPSKETRPYPTNGKWNSSSQVSLDGICYSSSGYLYCPRGYLGSDIFASSKPAVARRVWRFTRRKPRSLMSAVQLGRSNTSLYWSICQYQDSSKISAIKGG